MPPKTRTFVAGIFAALGISAAAWIVFGPAIERWWNTPKPRPIEHIVVETELELPQYTLMTAGDEEALARAVQQIETALRERAPDDGRVRSALSSTDRAEIARETAAIARVMLSGSADSYTAWLRDAGAEHPILQDPAGAEATRMMRVWTHNGAGLVGSPVDLSGVRTRVRFLNGKGPFDAPEDEIVFGWSSFPDRFPGMPDKGERMAAVVETIVPMMYVNHENGTASNTLVGFWMARHKPGDPWRLWRIALYDFERPSKAWVPVF
jgi:hypothetical protein